MALTVAAGVLLNTCPAAAAPPPAPPAHVRAGPAAADTARVFDPVVVPEDVTWTFDAPRITVTPNPPPPPPAPTPLTLPVPAPRTPEPPQPAAALAVAVPLAAPVPAAGSVVEVAARYVGVPYLAGGTSPAGFDCSGFTAYVYAQLGITLPRSSTDQRYAGTVVPADQAQPGDLIWSPGHVGIYAGPGTQIDAPRPGKTVQFRPIWQRAPIFIRVTG